MMRSFTLLREMEYLMTFWKSFGKTSRLFLLLVLPIVWSSAFAQTPPAAPGAQTWPRQFQSGTTTFTVYQPQVESWQWRTLRDAWRCR